MWREAASIQGFQREVQAMTDKWKVATGTQRTRESRRMVRLVVSLCFKELDVLPSEFIHDKKFIPQVE